MLIVKNVAAMCNDEKIPMLNGTSPRTISHSHEQNTPIPELEVKKRSGDVISSQRIDVEAL
jgi:hypothetical protein